MNSYCSLEFAFTVWNLG